jgi:hypothetical protein
MAAARDGRELRRPLTALSDGDVAFRAKNTRCRRGEHLCRTHLRERAGLRALVDGGDVIGAPRRRDLSLGGDGTSSSAPGTFTSARSQISPRPLREADASGET